MTMIDNQLWQDLDFFWCETMGGRSYNAIWGHEKSALAVLQHVFSEVHIKHFMSCDPAWCQNSHKHICILKTGKQAEKQLGQCNCSLLRASAPFVSSLLLEFTPVGQFLCECLMINSIEKPTAMQTFCGTSRWLLFQLLTCSMHIPQHVTTTWLRAMTPSGRTSVTPHG